VTRYTIPSRLGWLTVGVMRDDVTSGQFGPEKPATVNFLSAR